MTDRPILFQPEMVRALLAGTKTQTRRLNGLPVIEQQPNGLWDIHNRYRGVANVFEDHIAEEAAAFLPIQPGDRLWVKENYAIVPRTAYRDSEGVQQTLRPDDDHDAAVYAADWERSKPGRWRPSIHMFQWASRLTLHVTEARVQRLQDITSGDALAEGIKSTDYWNPKSLESRPFDEKWWDDATFWAEYPQLVYRELWDAINGTREAPDAWGLNPWIAAYTFEVERCNISQARNPAIAAAAKTSANTRPRAFEIDQASREREF